MSSAVAQLTGSLGRNRDLLLVAGLLGILGAILIPLPTWMMDGFIAGNLVISILILLTTVYVRSPLEFSVFPSLLLVVTLYRLALNIATTRLILGNGAQEGEMAAGRVIYVFGNFVTQNNAVVGMVIFAVIVIIQFLVITKGSTRIAEVAARFTLDKMPGQQLSIDADVNAGAIDESEARARRDRIQREADFYGAMDGASKFVRGDALAGIFITLINIGGGLFIGLALHGMSLGRAFETFTLLTIGDGLASQLPALIVSIAAGLLVTRTSHTSNLGTDLVSQLFGHPRAIFLTGGVMILLAGLLPSWFMILGAGALLMVGLALVAEREAREEAPAKEETPTRAVDREVLAPLEPLVLEFGTGLVPFVEDPERHGLLPSFGRLRDRVAQEFGVVLPPLLARDRLELRRHEYRVLLRGQPVATGEIRLDRLLVSGFQPETSIPNGIPGREPASGELAVWVDPSRRETAETRGGTVREGRTVLLEHLESVVRGHLHELLTRQDVQRLLDRARESSPSLVEDLVPERLRIGEVQKVLQNLLRESVSIRDLETILEVLADEAVRTRDLEPLTECVRRALGRSICRQHSSLDGRLHVTTLEAGLEEYLESTVGRSEGGSVLLLEPDRAHPIRTEIVDRLEELEESGHPPVLLAPAALRPPLRHWLVRERPGLAVISYDEITGDVDVDRESVARFV